MPDRRRHPTLRARFEALKADLLRRLAGVVRHLPPDERDALAIEMTRRRVRHDYRDLLEHRPV